MSWFNRTPDRPKFNLFCALLGHRWNKTYAVKPYLCQRCMELTYENVEVRG